MPRVSHCLSRSFHRSLQRAALTVPLRPAYPFVLTAASMSTATVSPTSPADELFRLTAPPNQPPTDLSPAAKTPPIYDSGSGQWSNPWPGYHKATAADIARMMWQTIGVKPLAGVELDTALPVRRPHWGSDTARVHYTWLGHATALVQLYDVNVLIDPVLSERCAPVQFAGPKRYRPAPCTVHDLPPIDVVVISHNHYDHLDYNTCKQLAERAEQQRTQTGRVMKWYVGKGIEQWLTRHVGVRADDAVGLVWWQHATHPMQRDGTATTAAATGSSEQPTVTCVPCQHISVRNPLTDERRTLWCGFTVTHRSFTLYYSGDTAYCEAFKQIGHHTPHIDLAILPIGAYEPSWFMKHVHVAPREAVDMMLDVKADRAVAVHWGTFILTTEPVMQPKIELEEELEKRGIEASKFITLQHGETILVK